MNLDRMPDATATGGWDVREEAMNRREFICGTAMAAVGCVVDRRTPDGGTEYSVSVLGDLHYDCPPVDAFHAGFR